MTDVNPDAVARDQLRAFVERIERLEEEKKGISDDIKEVYAEAKGNGFDVKVLRKVIAVRKIGAAERAEQEAILDLYLQALGMLADTPLGQAAIHRELPRRAAAKQVDLEEAIAGLGTPVPLTDEERAKGQSAAFEKNGTRMSIGVRMAPDFPGEQRDLNDFPDIPEFLDRRHRVPAEA
jgi:uncharacterized protein (UPF0335 family)